MHSDYELFNHMYEVVKRHDGMLHIVDRKTQESVYHAKTVKGLGHYMKKLIVSGKL